MAENVEYIDRNKLISEMMKIRQDLYGCNASQEVILWWSMAMRIVMLSVDVEAMAKDDARKAEWIPVKLTTMPPENEDGLSDNLILKTVANGRTLILVGFTQCGKWYSAMAGKSDVLGDEFQVTHWMYMTDLAEVV